MIAFGIGALLQLVEHEHLVGVRAVHAGLARGDAFAGHHDRLHAGKKLSSPLTHVADAITTRPVLRSTAITDQVANAVDGSARTAARRKISRRMRGMLPDRTCG